MRNHAIQIDIPARIPIRQQPKGCQGIREGYAEKREATEARKAEEEVKEEVTRPPPRRKRECTWDYAPRRVRCYHEAGHFVMALVLRRPVKACVVRENYSADNGGYILYGKCNERSKEALIALAGYAAEGLYRRKPHKFTETRNGKICFRNNSDVMAAYRVFRNSPIADELLRTVWRQARIIMKNWWSVVQPVAKELMASGKLTKRQISDMQRIVRETQDA